MKFKVMIIIALFIVISYNASALRDIYYGDYNKDLFYDYIDIPIVGNAQDLNQGILGRVRIGLINQGSGKIIFDSRTLVDEKTINSVITAVKFSEKFTNEKYDYFISYDLSTQTVSGQSTGAAITLGLKAMFEDRKIKENSLITGPIEINGNLMDTGGILLKTITAGEGGIKTFIMPIGHAETYIYEKIDNRVIAKKVNLIDYSKVKYNMEVIEMSNILSAYEFMVKQKI